MPKMKLVPSALLAVLLGVALNQVFIQIDPSLAIQSEHLVSIGVDGWQNFQNELRLPDWSGLLNAKVWTIALTIALVGSLESLLSIDAATKLDPLKKPTDKDQELIAQGLGNTLSGLIGGLPITAVIVRTTANISGGAKTKWSAIFHGILLLVSVVFLASWLEQIPLSALAAILLLVGFKLTPVSLYKDMYAKGSMQFYPFILTVGTILFTDLLTGVIFGIIVGMGYSIRNNIQEATDISVIDNKTVIRFKKDASFVVRPHLEQVLSKLEEGSSVHFIADNHVIFDHDIIEMLDHFCEEDAEKRNISVSCDDNLSQQRFAMTAK
jgi:MFS superfamily sulfate permease-like transporter